MIGNTGSNSTREALHATEQGFAVGMDAALQINPYYGKTSMTGLREHFKCAAGGQEGDCQSSVSAVQGTHPLLSNLWSLLCRAVLAEGPAIIYNVPGRTGGLPADAACSPQRALTLTFRLPNAALGSAGQDIPDDVILEMAQHKNFLGVKECTGTVAEVLRIAAGVCLRLV